MLATLQLMERPPAIGVEQVETPEAHALPEEVLVDGGVATMGTSSERWAYDNERPLHEVDLAPFFVDTTPVTNAAYLEFVDAGGYDDARWWSDDGWAWRRETGAEHPEFWSSHDGVWMRRRFGLREPLPPHEPVQHVCWYEADAYARWRGKRLPSEAEWERAATARGARPFPWGDEPTSERAALASSPERLGPGPVGMHPAGAGAG